MKVCGFTFIRNAIRFDYPIVEAITSILPMCDEFIVLVGNSDDNTRNLIERIGSDKIKIHDSIWDDSLREGGRVLAEETNKAMQLLPDDTTWAFYIQGDEVIHEKYHQTILKAMDQFKYDVKVEGLLLNYTHFYGSYDFIGDSTNWYRKEVRIIRKDSKIYSFRDAQGFQKNGRPLKVKAVDAFVYHYGWVKPPEKQMEKQKYFHKLWHNDEWVEKNILPAEKFDYSQIDSLAHFVGTHPVVMEKRIQATNWKFDFDPTQKRLSFKSKFKLTLEKFTGWRIGEYKNYKLF
ncbi:MAG: glycosyltransferase family 2 protein [Bacteroidia bacterium]|nr:glycosyltransferase family 2 protein [Bacteroidia bacterium]